MVSTISPETVAAYEATNYRVFSDPQFVINIGQPSKLLGRLYEVYGCASAAFITAWNPFSIPTSHEVNAVALTRLQEELGSRSTPFIDGIGEDATGQWPGEPSVLALGLSLDTAKNYGVQFEQNAIVWAGTDACPQLILLC